MFRKQVANAGSIDLRTIFSVPQRLRSSYLIVLSLLLGCASLASATELKPNTVAAFDKYVAATEARMTPELRPGGAFLFPDTLPPKKRTAAYQQLARGEIFISPLQTTVGGKKIDAPDGMIHHWV